MIIFDADDQYMIEYMKKVSKPIEQHNADLIIESRLLNNLKEKIQSSRKLEISIIIKVTNLTLKEKITDLQSGFRNYGKNTIKS